MTIKLTWMCPNCGEKMGRNLQLMNGNDEINLDFMFSYADGGICDECDTRVGVNFEVEEV